MRYFLTLILFSIVAFGQDAKFVPENPQEIFKLKNTFELKDDVILGFSLIENDRRVLIVGKKNIQILDAATKRIISEIPHEISKNHNNLSNVQISPNGKFLVVYDAVYSDKPPLLVKSKNYGAVIYDSQTGKIVNVLEGGDYSIIVAFWSENGNSLFTLTQVSSKSEENKFCFLDGDTLKYRNCTSVVGSVFDFRFSKDGTKFFTLIYRLPGDYVSSLGWIGIWDTQNVKLIKRLELYKASRISKFFVSPDKRYLGANELIIDIENTDLPEFYFRDFRGVSKDDQHFILKEKKGLRFYDFVNSRQTYLIPKIKDDYQTNVVTTDKVLINQNLARNCGRTEGFEIASGKKLWEIKLACHYESADCFFCSNKPDFNDSIDFLADGRYFLTSSEKAVRVWETLTGRLLQNLVNPNLKTNDKIKGERKLWSKDRKFIYFRNADKTKIFQFELMAS